MKLVLKICAGMVAIGAQAATLTTAEATALRLGGDVHAASQPRAISLAPAKWIWLPSQRTLPNTFVLFRKEVELAAAPERAFGWIAADSRYLVTINGQRVQWGPAPCDPRNLDADPLDLKPFLKPGKNVLGVEVLFYGFGDGTWPGGKPGLLFNLDLDVAGAHQQIVSDKSWLALLDRAHQPGHYKRWFLRALQEEFDARLWPQGWDTAGFQPDAKWTAAQELKCPPDKGSSCAGGGWSNDSVDHTRPEVSALRMRQIPPTRESIIGVKGLAHSGRVHWNRDPADWFDVRMPDSFMVDTQAVAVARGVDAWELPATAKPDEGVEATFEFTDQVVGFARFRINAPAGTIIELMPQESHDAQKTRWLDSTHFSWARFVCREGENEFETFDYESLRWLQLHIHNAARPVVVSGVGVRRRQYDWPHTPVIRTSEAPLQRLFDASINTLRNSAIDSIVDGMGRERQQYSGDGGHQMHAIRYAFGEQRIVARYLRTFSEGLTKSGFFLDCYPAFDRLARLPQRELDAAYWGPLLDHGVGFVFDNWNHYLETGDLDAEREPFPRLLRFGDYLWALRGKEGLLPVEDLGIPNVWIDHIAYRNQRNRQCAFNLYTAAMFTHALAPLAAAMGDAAHATEARERGAELLRATTAKFWSQDERVFLDNLPWLAEDKAPRMSDRALATSILFDQCPGNDTAAALKALVEVPKNMGFSYPCNAGWRYWALGKLGRTDAILKDFRTRWATMRSVIENNTLQEDWTAPTDASAQWSHCPLAPVFIVHQEIVGLRPLAPGFARVQLRPQLGDLPDLATISHTPRGPIEFKAQRVGAVHRISIKLPTNCEAELVLPAGVGVPFPCLDCASPPNMPHRYRLPAGGAEFTMPVASH